MFSGIVEGVGKVKKVEDFGEGKRIYVKVWKGFRVKKGDSVGVNGVCLTLVSAKDDGRTLVFDLSPETLMRSNLKYLKRGDLVNIEKSLKLSSGVSGHLVQGHVLTTLKILGIYNSGGKFRRFEFELKPDIKRYVIHKGFVAIDGISLTVSELRKNSFFVDIIPETWKRTNLKAKKAGDEVNFEPDMIVKVVVDILPDILVCMKGKKSFEAEKRI